MAVVMPLALFSAGLAGSAARAAEDDGSEVKVTLKGGKLQLKSVDGNFALALGGRVMADTAMYFDDKSDLGNGSELRRARLRAKGTVWKHWQFEGQYDFVGGDDHSRNAYIGYTGFKPWTLRVGHIKEPFGLENLTSSKYTTFMERALRKIHIQYPRRQVGMKVYDGGSSHLPVKVNPAGVIPAIFASSLLLLPTTISTFSANQTSPIMSTILA